jgi:hypothetical protein
MSDSAEWCLLLMAHGCQAMLIFAWQLRLKFWHLSDCHENNNPQYNNLNKQISVSNFCHHGIHLCWQASLFFGTIASAGAESTAAPLCQLCRAPSRGTCGYLLCELPPGFATDVFFGTGRYPGKCRLNLKLPGINLGYYTQSSFSSGRYSGMCIISRCFR